MESWGARPSLNRTRWPMPASPDDGAESRKKPRRSMAKEECRRLVMKPTRKGDTILYYNVTDSTTGDGDLMVWYPQSEEEREEARRFWKACQGVDWSVPG